MDLRVLSLNVWGLPAPVGRDVPERMRHIGAKLPELDADIAILQEVWTEEGRALLIAAGRAAGYEHVWHRPRARGGSGLLALSRVPIAGARFTHYDLCGLPQRIQHADYYGGKGFVELEVEWEGERVSIFGTHLVARYVPALLPDEYLGHRVSEVVQLARAVREARSPVVALGDFNLREDSREYRVLFGLTDLVDAAAELDTRQDTATLENPYRAGRGARRAARIDYVLTQDGRTRGARPVAIRRVFDEILEIDGEPATYSDHAGLVAEVRLGGPGRVARPPAPEAVALAHELLARGRRLAEERRTDGQFLAGSTLIAGGAGLLALRRGALSRRAFLRASLSGATGLAWMSSAGLFTLAERFVSEELRGYDSADVLLSQIATPTRPETGFATVTR